jgi:DNA-binding CsgD family transcriptional regulator
MRHAQMPGSAISARQLEVLLAGGRGLSEQQVAQELFLSVHTVKRHKEDAYKRLGVHGLAEAIYKLTQEGNLSLAEKPKPVPHPVEPQRSRVLQATATARPLPAPAQTYVDVFSVAMNPATPPAIRRSAGRFLHRAAADWGHGGHQVMLPIPKADMPAPAHRSFRDLIRAAIEHRIYGDELPLAEPAARSSRVV